VNPGDFSIHLLQPFSVMPRAGRSPPETDGRNDLPTQGLVQPGLYAVALDRQPVAHRVLCDPDDEFPLANLGRSGHRAGYAAKLVNQLRQEHQRALLEELRPDAQRTYGLPQGHSQGNGARAPSIDPLHTAFDFFHAAPCG